MSGRARSEHPRRIRDLGTRRIQQLNGTGTPGLSLPQQLEDTDFPTELGEELLVEYHPESNNLVLVPQEE